jgi:hypothetical protein
MKTEQELLERFKQINKELINGTQDFKNYKRRTLLKEYKVLHWVLFE